MTAVMRIGKEMIVVSVASTFVKITGMLSQQNVVINIFASRVIPKMLEMKYTEKQRVLLHVDIGSVTITMVQVIVSNAIPITNVRNI